MRRSPRGLQPAQNSPPPPPPPFGTRKEDVDVAPKRSARSSLTGSEWATKVAEAPWAVDDNTGSRVRVVDDDDDAAGDKNKDDPATTAYVFDGRSYPSYQEMVDAKRSRNQQVLIDSGLLDLVREVKGSSVRRVSADSGDGSGSGAPKNKKRKSSSGAGIGASTTTTAARRKSNRLAGIESDGVYVEDERAGRFVLATANKGGPTTATGAEESSSSAARAVEPEHYRGRINDGSPLTLEGAVKHLDARWTDESTASDAERFVRQVLAPLRIGSVEASSSKRPNNNRDSTASRISASHLQRLVDGLRADDEASVAKVTPDRIYGIAVHPHPESLLVGAGDKTGCVGIWKVPHGSNDGGTTAADGPAKPLFRIHKGAASCLQWTSSGSKLFSASYDGTVRCLDVESERFEQVFATYDDSNAYQNQVGHGMDSGYNYWTQYACLDPRSGSGEHGLFVSTSIGTAMHIDLRAANGSGRATFHEEFSEKKINTLSLHPNGHTLVSAGLDCTVKIWDLRKLRDSRSTAQYKAPEPLAFYHATKSVNSAFVSPSGQFVVCTTMANRLDLLEDVHLAPSSNSGKTPAIEPSKRIVHDNMTGRWLSTFMAQWHPSLDIFCVGSMSRPRCVQVFDAQGTCMRSIGGDALTAVASRCCFHPSETQLAIAGGNSSGRVTIIR